MESSGGESSGRRPRNFDRDLDVDLDFDPFSRKDLRESAGLEAELGPPPFVSETPAEGARPVPPSQRRERPRARPTRRRRAPGRVPKRRSSGSETVARVLWAVPWIIVAVAIVALGGITFAGAMIVFAWIGLSELFRMTSSDRPLQIVAFAASAGMIGA